MNNLIKFLKKLESLEKRNSNFWLVVSFTGIIFNFVAFPHSDSRQLIFQSPIEKSVAVQTTLKLQGGDLATPTPPTGSAYPPVSEQGSIDRGPDRFEDYQPKPSASAFVGSGAAGKPGSGSSSSDLQANKVPDRSDWDSNPESWSNEDSCQDFESSESSDELGVPVDFDYQLDLNGNPTLLVDTIGPNRNKRRFTKVEFDQSASHIHHSPELGIKLPETFDMKKYKQMKKADRIEYVKANVPREVIIAYQNEIGKSLQPIFGIKTYTVPGTAGKFKNDVELTIQVNPSKANHNRLSVVNDRGIHVSSHPVTDTKLQNIIKDEFWIWKEQNYN